MFLHYLPIFEKATADGGVLLVKYWIDVGMEEQERRFRDRIHDTRKTWKLTRWIPSRTSAGMNIPGHVMPC